MSDTPRQLTDRVTPQEVEVEKAVLGAMLIDREAIDVVREILGPEEFYHVGHRKIFAAIRRLHDRGEPADPITVTEELSREGSLDDIGGAATLAMLAGDMATAVNAEYHAKIVLEAALRRRLIDASTQTTEESYRKTEDVHDVLDRAAQRIAQISDHRGGASFIAIGDTVDEAFSRAQRAAEHPGQISGITTGIGMLDDMTDGWYGPKLIIVCGRASMGKTAFGMHAALVAKVPAAIFSREMSPGQLGARLMANESGLDSHRIRRGRISSNDWTRLAQARASLKQAPIYVSEEAVTVDEIAVATRKAIREYGVKLIVVDYLQLVRPPSWERSESREVRIGAVSQGLKEIATKHNVPVLALCQISRQAEQRTDKRPQLSDLRESGRIEQDGDDVIGVYRPWYYDRKQPFNYTELIVLKQRDGPVGTVEAYYDTRTGRFADWDTAEQEGAAA